MKSIRFGTAVMLATLPLLAVTSEVSRGQDQEPFQKIEFKSEDGLTVTADLYQAKNDRSKPFIVLCHQAGWSRGEYREIAPKLNDLGFNCMAIDQRSGGTINDVTNETAQRAKEAKKGAEFVDAEQDMIAALKYAKEKHSSGKLLLWGSSYSAALAIRIAGEHPELVDGVLSFAPGEYFQRAGKPADWIANSAKKITQPVFITSAKAELKNWQPIYEAIESSSKIKFLPDTSGNHGSRALLKKFDDSAAYWSATKSFLEQFQTAG